MNGSIWSLLLNALTTGAGISVFAQRLTSQNRTFSFQAILTGTGVLTATVDIEVSNDGSNWKAMHSFALSGVGLDNQVAVLTLPFSQIRANVTAITGTGAQVSVNMCE